MNHSATTECLVPLTSTSYGGKQRLIRIKEVLHAIGLGRTTLYALVKTGEFPAPRRVGKLSLWVDSEVQAWIRGIAGQAHDPRLDK